MVARSSSLRSDACLARSSRSCSMTLCPTRYEAPSENPFRAARAAGNPSLSPRQVKVVERSVRIAPMVSLPSRSMESRSVRRCAAKRVPTPLSFLHRSTAIGVFDLPGTGAGFGRNVRAHFRRRRRRLRDMAAAIHSIPYWREVCRARLHPRGRLDFTALGINGRTSSVKLGSLSIIGKLLGHNDVQCTARYAHLTRDSVKAASQQMSGSLAADMDSALGGGGVG